MLKGLGLKGLGFMVHEDLGEFLILQCSWDLHGARNGMPHDCFLGGALCKHILKKAMCRL